MDFLEAMRQDAKRVSPWHASGQVRAVRGHLIEVIGVEAFLSIGDRCHIRRRHHAPLLCEVVGVENNVSLLMPFGRVEGVGAGDPATAELARPAIYPCDRWLGRVVDAFGQSLDEKGPMAVGDEAKAIHNDAPPAHKRRRMGKKISLGVRAIDSFASCCIGQRMGIFSGSGVGKSVLLSMITRFSEADVIVVGLIGERGREVREFIEENLGADGLAKSVLVVATSNESALTRRQAAYTTMTLAEYFRDKGKNVLCLMDSVTRFAMAIREISLAAGEPPASKGYTPAVFAELPKLLERAGPGLEKSNPPQGDITGLFTVLVEGDDHNEPVSDAVRSILDGHITLDRAIAHRGRMPAVNVLKSVSRAMPGCNNARENEIIEDARKLIALYTEMEELIRLGTYQDGSDPAIDRAIKYNGALENFLSQRQDETAHIDENYTLLAKILTADGPKTALEGMARHEAEAKTDYSATPGIDNTPNIDSTLPTDGGSTSITPTVFPHKPGS